MNPHLSRINRLSRMAAAVAAQERVPVEEAEQGDPVLSDDGQRRYRAQTHDVRPGKVPSITLVRDVPKVRGKKARAEEKRQRRLQRERLRVAVMECPDCVKGLQPSTWVDDEQPNRLCSTCDGSGRVPVRPEYSDAELNCKGCDGPCGRCEEETVK